MHTVPGLAGWLTFLHRLMYIIICLTHGLTKLRENQRDNYLWMYHLFAEQFDLVKMMEMMEMITPSMPESGDGCLVDGVLTVEFCA
jgi:hypothetical protein